MPFFMLKPRSFGIPQVLIFWTFTLYEVTDAYCSDNEPNRRLSEQPNMCVMHLSMLSPRVGGGGGGGGLPTGI